MLQCGRTKSLSLKLLSFKLMMLISLARSSRSADLALLCINNCHHFKPESVTFQPSSIVKQSRQSKPLTDYFFGSFLDNAELYPEATPQQFQTVTSSLRKDSTKLLVAIIKPHKLVAPCTITQ